MIAENDTSRNLFENTLKEGKIPKEKTGLVF